MQSAGVRAACFTQWHRQAGLHGEVAFEPRPTGGEGVSMLVAGTPVSQGGRELGQWELVKAEK